MCVCVVDVCEVDGCVCVWVCVCVCVCVCVPVRRQEQGPPTPCELQRVSLNISCPVALSVLSC